MTGEAPQRPCYSRVERLAQVDSTQRVVREWLAEGLPEVAIATADVQTAGRGRHGRDWQAPPGAALLLSAGFRPPPSVAPRHGWRLGATVALAMLDAAEAAAGLRDDTLWLKWPNDIVAEGSDGLPRKVAGVLGEAALAPEATAVPALAPEATAVPAGEAAPALGEAAPALGEAVPAAAGEAIETAIVGIGINADWAAADFPPDLAPSMTSLRELAGGRPIDREQLLDEFLARLEPRYLALRDGRFDAGGWSRRQLTTSRQVEVSTGDQVLTGRATGVDPESGALLLERNGERLRIESGEVVRCRLLAGLPRNGSRLV